MDTQPTNAICITGPRAPRGFSLIELILVLTIISLVAAVALPRYANAVSNYQSDAAAGQIAIDINRARDYAIASSKKIIVEFKVSSLCMKIHGMPDINNTANVYEVSFAGAPYYATSMSADFGGKTKLTFDGFGEADSGGTVTVVTGTTTRNIVFDAATDKAVAQ